MATRRSQTLLRILLPHLRDTARQRGCVPARVLYRQVSGHTPGIRRRTNSKTISRAYPEDDLLELRYWNRVIEKGVAVAVEARYRGTQPAVREARDNLFLRISAFVQPFIEMCRPLGVELRARPALSTYQSLKRKCYVGDEGHVSEADITWIAARLSRPSQAPQEELPCLRTIGRELLRLQSLDGDVVATMRILIKGNSQLSESILSRAQSQHYNMLLKAVAAPPNEHSRRVMVLLGRILEARGELKNAIGTYLKAYEAYKSVKDEPESSAVRDLELELIIRPEEALRTPDISAELGLDKPWKDALRVYSAIFKTLPSKSPERKQLSKEASGVLSLGRHADDAECFYDSASLVEGEYQDEQMSRQYDEELGIYRVERQWYDITGKSARWLYYMTKAAATGIPQACYELGLFYLRTPWPYLDEEPPDSQKPTPFDRYPASTGDSDSDISKFGKRLLRAIGIPIFNSQGKAHESIFGQATIPAFVEQRLILAGDWLRTAASLGYAPALQDLIRLYATEHFKSDLAVPLTIRTPYDSRRHYFESLAHNKQVDRTWPESATKHVRNPLYDLEKAKTVVCDIFCALEARRIYLAITTGTSNDVWPRFMEDKVFHWTTFTDAFTTWIKDSSNPSERLENFAHDVCRDFGWIIFDDKGQVLCDGK